MNETVARDRNGLEVLGYDACLERLRGQGIGRVALLEAGTPIIFPVTYALAGSSVVWRSAVGSKLDAAERGQPVAFEIDGFDEEAREGWSVVVTGVADVVEDPEVIAGLEALGLDSWALDDAGDLTWVQIRAHSVTGRAARSRTAD